MSRLTDYMTGSADFIDFRIDIPIVDLERQRIISDKGCWILVRENDVEMFMEFVAQEKDDDTEVWGEKSTLLHVLVRKSAITTIQKVWLDKSKRWQLSIHWTPDNRFDFYFKKQKDVDEAMNKITPILNH